MQWVKFLELLHVGNNLEGVVKEILHQYILDKFFQLTLKYRNDVLCPKFEEHLDDDISPLETTEEQTIRYVAGYILYSVRKSVQNKRSSNGIAILKILSCWGSKSSSDLDPSSFLDCTKEWIEKFNRGSLVVINDDFCIFVRHLEIQTRKILNLNLMILYSGENIKLKEFEKLSENNLIRCYWEKLTRSVGNEDLKEKLKVKIVTKWIDIRVNAFIKTWVQIIRRKESRSSSSNDGRREVAMRKTLSTSSHVLEKGQPSIRKSLARM